MKIERLPIEPPVPATYEALRLIDEEAIRKYDDEAPPIDYGSELRWAQARNFAYYGLLEDESVLASAICEQRVRYELGSHEETATVVWNMAVRSDRQREGLGSLLMGHIAEVALTRGDGLVEVDSTEDGFYSSIGFMRPYPSEIAMRARPSEVLESTSGKASRAQRALSRA